MNFFKPLKDWKVVGSILLISIGLSILFTILDISTRKEKNNIPLSSTTNSIIVTNQIK